MTVPDEMITKQPLPTAQLEKVHALTLHAAAKSGNPVLAEIAREVRAGRLTLREAAASSAYHDTFAEGAGKALGALRELGPVEGGDDVRTVEQRLDDLVEGLSEWERQIVEQTEPADTAVGDAETTDDTYFDDTSIMIDRPEVDRSGAPQRARWNRRWS
ncbi:hypothetical protein [Amycolatopsis sp. EV170708-02-1]|uniref:hypothetical protein n=1 Tax=Amycolatopsis sp. EV170708-02-1 TaxID=2919322 RepID=UPI001F0C3BD1|nr:hypothetical protein [Amycolatopsis sp. EV170708-02-1]UMP04759.1 hypothetical protein MJQ72_07955 [Amycolatopsis sp. EV170708-02-1]